MYDATNQESRHAMTTPLQQAAQELIDRWDSPMWRYQQATTDVIAELRKALDAELAQSVEPWPTQDAIDVLRRFEETCLDNEGYDVPKNTMRILQAIGLVYRTYRDTYAITDFGERVLKGNSLHPPQPQATAPLVSFGWVVLDEDGIPAYCAQSRQLCNDHINEAISEHDIEEARKWVICEAYKKQGEKP